MYQSKTGQQAYREKKNDTEPQLNLRCKNNISLSEAYTFGVLF
jgi:hypothetical protein